MTHTCKACAKTWESRKGESHRKRSYCSQSCYHADRVGKHWPARPIAERTYVCRGCGVSFEGNYGDARRRKYCSSSCSYGHRTGVNHANWRGGRYVIAQGYVMVQTDQGPRMEHRVIAERVLGRRMKRNEHVHHINGNKQDNDPRNLLICTDTYHRALERRMATVYQREFPVYTLGV